MLLAPQKTMAVAVFSAITLFTSACMSEQGIDRTKFAELNRIARELAAVRDRARSKKE